MKQITFLMILGIALFSCQKDKIDNPDNDLSEKAAQITLTEIALESAATEMEYEVDFYANAEQIISNWWKIGMRWQWTNKLRYKINHCPLVTIEREEGGYPVTITLDYGEGTTLLNGRVLKGIIIIEISGGPTSPGHTRLVTYDNFSVDTLTIEGSSTISINKGEEVFRNIVSDLTFTLGEGMIVDRHSERTWEWMEGIDTETDQTDDVIRITGFTTAENSDGDVYRKEIADDNPLIRKRGCPFIVQGIVEITINGELISSLDYGDGECNNIAILTKDGETFEVDLSKRKMRHK
jgi:hypothetical protein